MRDRLASQEGGVLVLVAFALPVLILLASFAIDLGNWWVHKKALQNRADAAAFAGAGAFQFPCNLPGIVDEAEYYGGESALAATSVAADDLPNARLGGRSPSSATPYVASVEVDEEEVCDPDEMAVDVTVTEAEARSPCRARG
jgi:uncharacterized membrane protein